MAKIKVFVSSTCYDLSQLRDQLRSFIENLGYEPVMSEFGDVTYDPRIHTHTSCIREVDNCDILVLVIGSRFGGEAVPESLDNIDFEKLKKEGNGGTYLATKHLSITQVEVLRAIEKSIPIYTFIENNVLTDHRLYALNKSHIEVIKFPSIEKPETAKYIFGFIDYLRLKQKGNNYFPFISVEEIKNVLKKQWSGYFQRLLHEQRENNYHNKKTTGSKETAKTLILQLHSRHEMHSVFSINQKFHINDGLYEKISHIRIMNFASNLMINPEIGEAGHMHQDDIPLSDAIEKVMRETNALVELILTEPNKYNLDDLKTKIANKRAGSSDGALFSALATMYTNLSTDTIYSRRYKSVPILFRFYVMKTSIPFGIFNVEFLGDAKSQNHVQVDLYSAALSNEDERRCFVIWQKDDPENYQFFVNNFNNIKNNPQLCKEPTLETMKRWADRWREIQLI